MASLRYLWINRAQFPIGTKLFVRAWGKRVFSLPELIRRNHHRLQLIKRGANIDQTAEIGEVKVEGLVNLVSIGAFCSLGRVYMAVHEHIKIGERVVINDGVKILTASHDVSDPHWSFIKQNIVIEDYVWIGTDAIILPGVHLGRGVVVGAGAVVTKSVNNGAIVVGNPAKPISKTRCKELNYNPCEFLAANRAWLLG
ncbi:acyltransferase [Adhaeribacter pallidiroseus]|uniref:Galactoside O-acetyltransferase n=1 Tax=Adhaeribacter pallidiroseus TaxID=2072847 RepID=A0A369QP24_9BACT|nr:DapH/DapD/GlmU-related protein [Adhaeribacter pallidiroseus]RDC66092.1 Galactoside O-acetyltransferase [Adhaeribacter pallidiroseus]